MREQDEEIESDEMRNKKNADWFISNPERPPWPVEKFLIIMQLIVIFLFINLIILLTGLIKMSLIKKLKIEI